MDPLEIEYIWFRIKEEMLNDKITNQSISRIIAFFLERSAILVEESCFYHSPGFTLSFPADLNEVQTINI